MLSVRRVLVACVAIVSIAGVTVADRSMIDHIPADCQIGGVVDFEKIVNEPTLQGLIQMISPQAEAEGFPPLTSLNSMAFGIVLPDDPNSGDEPTFYIAFKASSSLEKVVPKMIEEGFVKQGEYYTKDVVPGQDGSPVVVHFDSSMTTAHMAMTTEDIDAMMAAADEGSMGDSEAMNATGGSVSEPFFYMLADMTKFSPALKGEMEQGVMMMSGMMAMQMQEDPNTQALAQSVSQDFPAILKAQTIEIAAGFKGENMASEARLNMDDAANADKLKNLINGLVDAAKKQDPNIAQQMANVKITSSDTTLAIGQEVPKAMLMSMAGMAMMMAGGGGGEDMGGGAPPADGGSGDGM